MITTTIEIKLHDIVKMPDGSQFIIVDIKPNRPSNQFVGILVNGKGAPYKFGFRHRPTVAGHAEDNHPALVAYLQRTQRTFTGFCNNSNPASAPAAVFFHLLEAVEAGDMSKAKILAAAIRTMPGYAKAKPSGLFAEYEEAVRKGIVERFDMRERR